MMDVGRSKAVRTDDHRFEHIDDGMLIVQVNLDDMSPEWCAYVGDRLFEAGASDVFWIPILMKKGRPGVMLNVLVDESRLAEIERIVFTETTTFGLRYVRTVCHRLGRRFETVDTPWGPVRVKIGYYRGEPVEFAPEYADCEAAARRGGVPLKRVFAEARKRWMDSAKAEPRQYPPEGGAEPDPGQKK